MAAIEFISKDLIPVESKPEFTSADLQLATPEFTSKDLIPVQQPEPKGQIPFRRITPTQAAEVRIPEKVTKFVTTPLLEPLKQHINVGRISEFLDSPLSKPLGIHFPKGSRGNRFTTGAIKAAVDFGIDFTSPLNAALLVTIGAASMAMPVVGRITAALFSGLTGAAIPAELKSTLKSFEGGNLEEIGYNVTRLALTGGLTAVLAKHAIKPKVSGVVKEPKPVEPKPIEVPIKGAKEFFVLSGKDYKIIFTKPVLIKGGFTPEISFRYRTDKNVSISKIEKDLANVFKDFKLAKIPFSFMQPSKAGKIIFKGSELGEKRVDVGFKTVEEAQRAFSMLKKSVQLKLLEVPKGTIKESIVKPEQIIKVPVKAEGKIEKVEIAVRDKEITKQQVFDDVPVPDAVESAVLRLKNKGTPLQRFLRFRKGREGMLRIEKQSWELVQEAYARREGLKYEYQNKWNEIFTKPRRFFPGRKQKYSKQVLEDMIFYRQHTQNPFMDQIVKSKGGAGDTFKAVSDRLSLEVKGLVDKTINEHFQNMLKVWNDSPMTKDINPREHIAEIYLPHIYTNSPSKLAAANNAAMSLISKRFKTNNPFANKKVFETYVEALEKKGLIPRYRNIQDILNVYDGLMVRLLANNEFIGKVRKLEKDTGQKLIARSNNKELYQTAKNEGWEPFHDPYLRAYVAGKTKAGKTIWATTEAPALLHPEFAGAVRGVFGKDAYMPDRLFWRSWDAASSYLKYIRVSLSGFHAVPLTESLVGSQGFRVLNILSPMGWTRQGTNWMKKTQELINDPVVMRRAIEAGLKLRSPAEIGRSRVEGNVQSLKNWLDLHGRAGRVASKGVTVVEAIPKGITSVMFDQIHPRFKILSFESYRASEIAALQRKGVRVTEKMEREIGFDIAESINDQFGHQAWELIRIFNDPAIMKWSFRVGGYVDWSISALRQATGILYPGTQGKLARAYWLRYGIAFLTMQQFMSYLNTGLKNNKDGSVSWDIDKAHSTFDNKDPRHQFDFQLPDIELEKFGVKWNPGRDEKGRRYYSHFGKQMLEIPRYGTNVFSQLFSKSNPLIQMGLTQVFGGTPFKGGIYPARGKFVGQDFRAWDGTREFTVERVVSRAKEFVGSSLPFSVQSLEGGGIGTLALLPVSKGTGIWASEPFVEDALRNEDFEAQNELVEALLDNGYSRGQIRGFFKTINARINRENETK